MEEFFASGHVADLVLALMAMETMALIGYRRMSGRGIATAGVLTMIAAGGCLVLALRMALTGAGWLPIAGALAAALVLHVSDLVGRWT